MFLLLLSISAYLEQLQLSQWLCASFFMNYHNKFTNTFISHIVMIYNNIVLVISCYETLNCQLASIISWVAPSGSLQGFYIKMPIMKIYPYDNKVHRPNSCILHAICMFYRLMKRFFYFVKKLNSWSAIFMLPFRSDTKFS